MDRSIASNICESWSTLSVTYCMNVSDTLSTSTECFGLLLHCTCNAELRSKILFIKSTLLKVFFRQANCVAMDHDLTLSQ